MSIGDLPILPELQLCQSPIYNDNRWSVRPQAFRTGTAADLDWITTPMQPPYLATDTPRMSYDLTTYTDKKGHLKPEVAPDPCIPYHTQYCTMNKPAWVYDHTSPSLILPKQPCKYWGKTSVPDVACLDQQEFMPRDQFAKRIRQIKTT